MPTVPVMAITVDLGAAVPATSGQPGLVDGNNNFANTPGPTGAIAVPQSPLGTPTTNTNRTTEATQSYMAASLNILNVGKTPPPTGNLPH